MNKPVFVHRLLTGLEIIVVKSQLATESSSNNEFRLLKEIVYIRPLKDLLEDPLEDWALFSTQGRDMNGRMEIYNLQPQLISPPTSVTIILSNPVL